MRFSREVLRAVALAAAALAASATARADDDDDGLVSDRPDFVESSQVVGKGRFQIEGGGVAQRQRSAGATERSVYTPFLLRYGVSERWELRLETDGYQRLRTTDGASGGVDRANGWNDISLGAKWHVQDSDEAAGVPSLAWLVAAELPTGTAAFRGRGVRPSLRVIAEWDLPDGYGIGLMPGVFVDDNDDGRRYAAGLLALTFDKRWNHHLHTFVEFAGQRFASGRNGGSILTLDLGGAWLVTDDFQLDLALARHLNGRSPDQWMAGFSVRF